MILAAKIIVITVIWVLGFYLASSEGMVFYGLTKYAETRKSLIWQPIVLCVWCMPSIHSLIGYLFAAGLGVITHFSWRLVFMYPIVVMASAFLGGFLWRLNELAGALIMRNKNTSEKDYLHVKDMKRKYNNQKSFR